MTAKTILLISYLSALVPFIIAIATFRNVNKNFHPFFYFLFLLTCVHLIHAAALIFLKGEEYFPSVILVANIYAFLEIILIFWIFKYWGVFKNKEKLFQSLLLFCIIIGLINCYYSRMFNPVRYFESVIRIIATALSITMINNLTKSIKNNLSSDPRFIICCGFIVYYFIDLASSILLFNFVTLSNLFQLEIYKIAAWCSLISLAIFTYALLLILKDMKTIHSQERRELKLIEP